MGPARLRGFIFYPEVSAVGPQCVLAVCCVRCRPCRLMICLLPRGSSPHQDSAGTVPSSTPPLGLFKIFVCVLGDCALVNTILGMQHLPSRIPPVVFFNQHWAIYAPPFPPWVAIQHTILVMAISRKGQTAAGPAAPSTTDTRNTVTQRANRLKVLCSY